MNSTLLFQHRIFRLRMGICNVVAGILFAVTLSPGTSAQVAPTRVMIRVVAHDAKIIGSGVGGAAVTITNTETGDTLASGVQEGSTGDTRNILWCNRGNEVGAFSIHQARRGFLQSYH